MGRPEPCVLFSQTFVHPQLDEYVDEVLFAEPVVIFACEFLEQNASSISQLVPLVGATLPPSFALEVFVQCEGETRFRRLCQPFLYSHSSSNVLEVEAVVTNHLVVRGSYRSLSLIIYGNTAEDLGQFNIEFDDNSLTNIVSSAEGGLEDLPLALRSTNRKVEESLSSLNVLSLPVAASDISVEVKQFLQLILKMLGLPNLEDSVYKVVGALVAAVCSYVSHDLCCVGSNQKHHKLDGSKEFEQMRCVINDAGKQLLEVLRHSSEDEAAELLAECTFESHADVPTSKQLVDMLIQHVSFKSNSTNVKTHRLSESENITLRLGLALLLCSGRESCFHFVNVGGLDQLTDIFSCDTHDSSSIMLLLLGVIEQATRHPIGCEGILGWWPREDENIPSGISKGYSQLLKLLLKKPPHDLACLATRVLHRLRFYEVASRYECAVLSILGSLCAVGRFTNLTSDMLNTAKSQLKRLLKLINSHGPVEDPSPVACASRSLVLGQTEGLLSYKATSGLIGSSNCCFAKWDVDLHLLGLLKERGFLPLSAALLSSPVLRSKAGHMMNIFIDIASTIGAILLSLLMSRSGLIFLSHYPELSTTLIDALRGGDMSKEDCVPLRYASVLMSKGFVCSPREVGIIVEMHLRVVNAIDRLVASTPHSEEFLWVLWELCGLSRSDCGRQALLVLGYFPEAVSILIEALHLVKESEPVSNGASPINLAIFHSASEIFEIIVNDSTASSLGSWIGHAMDLHKALHSSSPGSNRKDAPTRLLEWIDTGVVYHKNGAIGLLRYSAVLASGGDAHLTSTNILVSDLTDVENVIGDASGSGDINVMDNLGKIVSEKTFDGVVLRDSSIAQLTTAIRILAFVSENSTVAAALYDEGAITVIYAILVNCSFMLERSSNNYDYLVDEGAECNSTSDLLLERNREQSLVDLLVPSLVLLTILLQKLQEANEQHRNTKLMNALLRLHREVSPKLAACAADLSSSYPDSALGFGAVCHLVVSALTFWPVYGWTPGLFHSLLSSVQVTSLMALGPKETCSLLCLLIDLFPEEGIWLWKNGMPLLSALRTLAVGTILGPLKEKQVNWYLESLHLEKLLSQLTPQLDKIAQIIQHYAISGLVVIRDMLRVFIVRIACQRVENASKLLRPILSSIHNHILDLSSPSEIDAYKVYRYLDFIASLLEHPCAKMLLLEEGLLQVLLKVLEKCFGVINSDGKQILDGKNLANYGPTLISWCLPVFKCLLLLLGSETSLVYPGRHDLSGSLSNADISLILPYLLRFCQVLPDGKELLSCLTCFKELGSCNEGRNALVTLLQQANTSNQELASERGHERNENYSFDDFEWKNHPLLNCWKKLMKSIDTEDDLAAAVEAVNELSTGSLCFCMDGKSLNLKAVAAIKYLFGLHDNADGTDGSQIITLVEEMIELLNSKTLNDDCLEIPEMTAALYQAAESVGSLVLLFEKPTSSATLDQLMCIKEVSSGPKNVTVSMKIDQMSDTSAGKLDDFLNLGDFGEKFLWECPETLPDKSIPGKRKLSSLDGAAKRAKGENSAADITSQSTFSRTLGPSTASSGPTRRDTFRQRKPNTSRPPSMHVDDYVARERNVDGSTNSNVISIPRLGSTGGRPPSIHVDEFMARQRERQNPTAAVVAEPSTQLKNAAPISDADKEIVDKSKQLKTDLDDELQGIDIVFDGEESESDDKLPFPQPDDNLQQPAPVIVEQSSPHSIVEETESEVNESGQFPRMGTPLASNADENTQSEYSSRMSVSRPEMPLTREPSVSSDKKFFEHSDELNNNIPVKTSVGFDSVGAASTSGFASSFYNKAQLPMDSRMNPHNMYPKNSQQHASGSRGHYDQKVPLNQPPLPPMPPPSTISSLMSQNPDPGPGQSSSFINSLTDMHPPLPTGFQVQSDYMSTFGNNPASSHPMADSKYSRGSTSSPSGSAGPQPPLPPTPPPFSSSPYNNLQSLKASTSQSSAYNVGTSEFSQSSISQILDARFGNLSAGGGLSSYMPPPLMPPLGFNRPATSSYVNTPTQQQGENPAILQNMAIPQSSMQAIHHLQPLQPPLQRPAQPPQHLWPPVQPLHQLDQGVSLQNHVQMHQLQVLQQPPMHGHYPSQQQEASHSRQQQQQQVEHVQAHNQHQPELGMSLNEYFQDPKAITALLSNKEELCRLLEQNPKLMQMLQEKLGQQ
ncbi:protein virilizer homolog [Euphorbia lathyris]|uniref:protein virilizer homolog n=1 Tax=Euphorbia lathyris TaxID=212925 RepID=UPI0033139CBD